MTLLDTRPRAGHNPNLCSVCQKNPVYIGTMCRECYEEQAYPGGKPPAPPKDSEEGVMAYTDEEIAQMVHTAFLGMQAVQRDDMPSPPWMCMPRSQRRTAVAGVQRVRRTGMGARANHENWVAGMMAAGWVRGDVKDPEKMTHPAVCPWDELPQDYRDRAGLFVAMVRFLDTAGGGGEDG